MTAPTRPVLRYHGGKWKLAPWLLSFFPAHRVYVEPFGGGASVLFRKPRSYAEVYNDLDDEIVNVFRVLRDPATANRKRFAVALTPYSRTEFRATYGSPADDPIERARRIVVRSCMGFGSAAVNRDHRTGFRPNSNRSGTTPAHDWVNWPGNVDAYVERLRGVIIENHDYRRVIAQHDGPTTLFYVDPPYPFSTRSFPRGAVNPFCYRHELRDDDHRELAGILRSVAGLVVLSGYPCELYDRELYPDWTRREVTAHAGGKVKSKRTEVVWLNPACDAALRGLGGQLQLDEVPA